MLLLLELGEEARVRVPDTAARDVLPGHLGQDDGLRGRAAPVVDRAGRDLETGHPELLGHRVSERAEREDRAVEGDRPLGDEVDDLPQLVVRLDEALGVAVGRLHAGLDPTQRAERLVRLLDLGALRGGGEAQQRDDDEASLGDVADAAYFVVGGRVSVHVVDEGVQRLVAELGRGEVVGELGLLDRAPRSATVRAVRDTTLASFSAATFEDLVTISPSMMLNVTRRILLRLRSPSQRRFDRASSLTVAVTAKCDANDLVSQMAAEIARFGSTKHLSSDHVDRVLNRTAISQAATDNVGVPRLAEFMHEADVGNDHVVLQTDPDMTAWTRRALRQADRVVVVCSPNPDAAERALISDVFATIAGAGHVARMLAVLHPASTERPRGTAQLAAPWRIDDVVHLRRGSVDDVARLARLASGNGYGLVLSGGGARGFAHLGVLRALVENRVPIDKVAGCSMGAVIASGIALGPRDEELLALVEKQSHRLLDYTIPVVSLLKGGRITRNIERTFDGRDIEDLWLPFYCVSTNLTKSRLEVHRRGDTALAVRASLAIPGVLPPVPYQGDLLVDGGVLNNLPFEAMRDDSTVGTIVAVDVAPDLGPRAHSDFGMSVSGVRALWASATPGRSPLPSATSVLLRSMMSGSVRHQRESMQAGSVDLVVTLHLPGIGMLEFERTREVAEVGYNASKDTVAEWAATRTELGVA